MFLMPLLLVLIGLGVLLVTPMLSHVSTGLISAKGTTEDEFAYYSADAGIEAVLHSVRQGDDVLDASYQIPIISLNNYTSTVTILGPPRPDVIPFGPIFADPGTESGAGLSPLSSTAEYLYEIQEVQGNSQIQVNWAFTPSGDWEINIYEGVGTGGTQIGSATGSSSPARLTISAAAVNGGIYTVRFYNNSSVSTNSEAFSPSGDSDETWVRATAFIDYVITSTAGPVTLTVFVRQGPGPDQNTGSDYVASWHGPN